MCKVSATYPQLQQQWYNTTVKPNLFPTKIALVYDWVNTPYGGAERVLVALHKIFPQAPLYTAVYDPKVATWAKDFTIKTSFLQNILFSQQRHRELLPLLPLAFESLDLTAFDLVISITSAQAKAIKVHPNALHICYLLTPTRYLWSHTHKYQQGRLQPIKALIFSWLRQWDYQVAQKPQVIIAISQLVKQRTQKYYRRSTHPVIYPPFQFNYQTKILQTVDRKAEYYLVVSRLVPYKKVDLCIRTCVNLGKNLIIVGDGPESKNIQSLIQKLDPQQKLITWYSQLTDTELQHVYAAAKALLLPAEEDFGITALEAQAFGKPVIVYQHSGAAEVVKNGITGIHFSDQTLESLSGAILESQQHHFDSAVIKSHALLYNERTFMSQFETAVRAAWEKHQIDIQKGPHVKC